MQEAAVQLCCAVQYVVVECGCLALLLLVCVCA